MGMIVSSSNMFKFFLTYLLLCICVSTARVFPIDDTRLLTRWPVMMSHDSSTGEIIPSRDGIITDVIDAYSITQDTGLVGQLNCGTRAYDYRPYLLSNSSVISHHGGTKVHKLMADSITDISNWLNIDSNSNELVLLYLSHFDGDITKNGDEEEQCRDASIKLLNDIGIKVITNCDTIATLTVAEAYKNSRLSTDSGSLIAVVDCMDERFDSTVNCYGTGYCCYDSWPYNQDIPWNHLKEYSVNATLLPPSSSSMLWMLQAHWQSSTESVALGNLHLSSVVEDESKAGVNVWLANAINTKGYFPYLNIVEVDNVCDHGIDIYNALLNY